MSFGATSLAFMFSCTCSTRLAPVITVLTYGFFKHQASASCESVQSSSSAIGLERLHPGKFLFICDMLMQPIVAFERRAAVFGDAFAIFAAEQTRSQRAKRGRAVAIFLIHALIFSCEALTLEQVIDRLFRDRLVQVMSFCNFDRGNDLCRRPFRCAPVKRLAPFDDIVHRPDGLFDGRGLVGAVTVEHIHVIKLQAFQRTVDAFDQVVCG